MSDSSKTLEERQRELRSKMATTRPKERRLAIIRTMKATGAYAKLKAMGRARHTQAIQDRAELVDAIVAARPTNNWEDAWAPGVFDAQRELAASRSRRRRRNRSAVMEAKHQTFLEAQRGASNADDEAYDRWLNGETGPS